MAVITRVYDDFASAERARANLEALGIANIDVSMLGDERLRQHYGRGVIDTRPEEVSGAATGLGVGAVAGGGAGLLAGLGMIAIPGIGPLVAAGWLAATAVGAVGGAVVGSAIGSLADIGITEAEAPVFHEALRRGSVALTVRFPDASLDAVTKALDHVSGIGLADLRNRYEAEGWIYDDAEAARQERLRNSDPGRIPPL